MCGLKNTSNIYNVSSATNNLVLPYILKSNCVKQFFLELYYDAMPYHDFRHPVPQLLAMHGSRGNRHRRLENDRAVQ